MLFLGALFVTGIIGGATAAVAGFGIGSLLTPLVAWKYGTPLAVAAVSVPHAIATALRCWRLRRNVDLEVLRTFGLLSAAGGLAGGLLFTRFSPRLLTGILGALLLMTTLAALTNWTARWRPGGAESALLGLASGLFGGVVGNQGGLRAAALLAFSLGPAVFVATSTATGLMVDAVRMPFYVARAGGMLMGVTTPIVVASIAVVVGTMLGESALFGMSPARFRQVIGVLIALVGVWLLRVSIVG